MMNMQRTMVAVSAVALVFGIAGTACQSEGDTRKDTGASQKEAAEESSAPDTGSDIGAKRTAYGLPLPPKVADRRDYDGSVQVQTRMDLKEVIEFFRTHPKVKNYEILQPADWKLRMVGLQEFMPEVEGYRYGPLVHLTYRPARKAPERPKTEKTVPSDADGQVRTSGDDEDDDSAASQRMTSEPWERSFNTSGSRRQGEPVRIRTPDGELLAPGAKWGEPYTPPEGTPLHKDRYRSNFGRDFGDWRAP
jgi:hypothetical protein